MRYQAKVYILMLVVSLMLSSALLVYGQDDEDSQFPVTLIIGEAEVRRGGQTVPLNQGDTVSRTDVIVPGQDSLVQVTCSDGNIDEVRVSRSVCQDSAPPSILTGLLPTRSNGALDPTIPYLVTPRNTFLLTDRPEFRWLPVEDAASYNLQVLSTGEEILSIEGIEDTSVDFPEDRDALEAGIYTVQIEALDARGAVINQTLDPNRFRVIEAETVAEIEADLADLGVTDLSDLEGMSFDAVLPVVEYLIENRLFAVAQPILTDYLDEVRDPRLEALFLLGSTYSEMDYPLATEAYMDTLAVAQERNEPAYVALSHWGIGMLSGGETEFCHLDAAVRTYADLDAEAPDLLRLSLDATNLSADEVDCATILMAG